MELTNFANFRNDFISDIESVDNLTLQTTPLNENMSLKFKVLKDFFSYLSAIHILEPVFSGDINLFIKASEIVGNYSMTYEEFKLKTLINDNYTIKFTPITTIKGEALAFMDTGKFGERNVFKPLGTNNVDTLDSSLTMSLAEASDFFNSSFKNKFYKGTITFSSVTFYSKGEIIYISDRDFYLIITSFKNNKNGAFDYSGLITIKGS